MKLYDCAIIGGGPAGLNAALVLGRARRHVVLFDDNKPRNAVTRESHGFITRDGVKPDEFRRAAHLDISKYPSVQVVRNKAVDMVKRGHALFLVKASTGEVYQARTIILALGLKEKLPDITGVADYYGSSLFSCPYCDGWELRDQPLAVISENESHRFSMASTVYNWSKDLIVCTNGVGTFEPQQRAKLMSRGVRIFEQPIASLRGKSGRLQKIVFADGTEVARTGGFVTSDWYLPIRIAEKLGCRLNESGGLAIDDYGKTTVEHVYTAGDAATISPAQLIVAAAGGSKAAMSVNTALTHLDF
ncbi:NAD(P)/FAD-dependent oxidoreductase [Paenibacillus sp. JDR-2]|uniref:NAD(P)/FAD-dependent oxidoreductase n=1 Tax=Paenibacillus sp. (strain JDR-2) TaxID=324057 RepID=UPI000166B051|nr:NAD(P)/FAD-dependent oxidoreductase [Paenibacillus sp. JDR-2]ACS99054.1 FAD-dependent pyridine nucleotide-disulphide oxidoreductase [Paenibacillus sp. JDR-2]